MKLRVVAWALVSAPVAVLVAIGTPSCSSSSKSPEGLAEGCSINSDCNDPLVCAFSLCHQQCAASRDCAQGERCIETNGVGICELPAESSCAMGKTCTGGLVCGPDQQCRAACTTSTVSTACAQDQVCSQGLCYDPGELGDASMGTDSGSSSGSGSGSGSGAGIFGAAGADAREVAGLEAAGRTTGETGFEAMGVTTLWDGAEIIGATIGPGGRSAPPLTWLL